MGNVIWRRFLDTEYEVSNTGIIKSLKNNRVKILKPGIDKYGYQRVDICRNNKAKHYLVHKLVALCFIENQHNKCCVNHKDGNKLNNHVSNLEWCTIQENTIHAAKNKLFPDNSGSNNGHAKLRKSDILEIRKSNESPYKIGPKYNVSPATIYDIRKRRSWSHIN